MRRCFEYGITVALCTDNAYVSKPAKAEMLAAFDSDVEGLGA